MTPLTAGERIALVAVVETSRIPGKARPLAALDRVVARKLAQERTRLRGARMTPSLVACCPRCGDTATLATRDDLNYRQVTL